MTSTGIAGGEVAVSETILLETDTAMWDVIAQKVSQVTGKPFTVSQKESVGGGCINSAYIVSDAGNSYFVKTNSASLLEMFEAEYEGLIEMASADAVRVPQPVCVGTHENTAYIVMENLQLYGGRGGSSTSLEQLGVDLACMHQARQQQFGWHRNNTIGSTLQINQQENDWITFWREHRLRFQYDLAASNGFGGALQVKGERLLENIQYFFTSYHPEPSLLHGDLWSGNYAIDDTGNPVIFDPAVYYGDREADIAMTELFGGFSPRFYSAYNGTYQLDGGYKVRKILYNLYHILNHLNLFGGGYLSQANRMTEQLLVEVR